MQFRNLAYLFLLFSLCFSCGDTPVVQKEAQSESTNTVTNSKADALTAKYTTFTLDADLSSLSAKQKEMVNLLITAAEKMNELFWFEAYGDGQEFLDGISDPGLKQFAKINYGPWDRLDGNKPFLKGVGEKAKGANYYPADMTKQEFEKAKLKDKDGLYTFIRRDEKGKLYTVPYHEMFATQIKEVSDLLRQASDLAEDASLKKYLNLRAKALLDDEYQRSDFAWLDMKTNQIDCVIGPIETYEDQLFGYKASHEAYVLLKDMEWSKRLEKYAQFLPELQKGIPVPAKYKKEKPGSDTELNAYDVVYYAGDCNAGSKTIAINLPNDEEVQLQKGTRRLQLKNAMRAKFDKILLPIAEELIHPDQRGDINFDAFFSNTMFHEVAHGLGIKNTLDGKRTVRKALKEHASAIEEGKADILGLYMINQLHAQGEIKGELKNYYTTFMASIFRSVRFGASSAHGKANMIRYNYFKEMGAFVKDVETNTYKINMEKFAEATQKVTEIILTMQGDGDYDRASKVVSDRGVIDSALQADLDRLTKKGIPVDVVFEQGVDVLGI